MEAIYKKQFAVDTESRAFRRLNGYGTFYVGYKYSWIVAAWVEVDDDELELITD